MANTDLLKQRVPYVTAGLAFVAGFADTASFIGAGGIFSAHVTGNFVVFAADIARGARSDEWLKLATFPIFVIAVALATVLYLRLQRAQRSTARTLVLVSAALLAATAVVCAVSPDRGPGPQRDALVALLVLAMGAQNAMHRLHPALGPMTTVMTGNVTGFVVEKLRPAPIDAPRHPAGGPLILSFAAGCAAGAFTVQWWGLAAVAIPAVLLLGVRALMPPGT